MTTPLERRDHVAGEVDKPARAERSELDRQIDVLLQNDVSLTSRAQARRRIEAGEGVLGAASAAAAPTAYEIPGQLLARKQATATTEAEAAEGFRLRARQQQGLGRKINTENANAPRFDLFPRRTWTPDKSTGMKTGSDQLVGVRKKQPAAGYAKAHAPPRW